MSWTCCLRRKATASNTFSPLRVAGLCWDFLDDRSRRAIECLEEVADGLGPLPDLNGATLEYVQSLAFDIPGLPQLRAVNQASQRAWQELQAEYPETKSWSATILVRPALSKRPPLSCCGAQPSILLPSSPWTSTSKVAHGFSSAGMLETFWTAFSIT